jgi:pyruvate formate lyase activating enzyme
MKEGKTGICGVRRNVGGKLDLIVYGKIIGPGPSPMEKKPMFHFMPGTNTYSIATVGCNFFCKFCSFTNTK